VPLVLFPPIMHIVVTLESFHGSTHPSGPAPVFSS
jgi:hypothetical protein